MKTAKLVIGILSIVLSVFVMFQGCTANVADVLAENETPVGALGILVAIFLLIAGIIAIATRDGKAGGIIAGVFYFLGGFVGLCGTGTYFADLEIWSALCFVFAAICVFGSIIFIRKHPKTEKNDTIRDNTVAFFDGTKHSFIQSDEQFEYYCEYLLKRKYYFKRVQSPVKTNDRNCDLIAYRKDGMAWVIFCIQEGAKATDEVIEKLIIAKNENRAQYMAIMTATHVSNGVRMLAKEKDIILFEELTGDINVD